MAYALLRTALCGGRTQVVAVQDDCEELLDKLIVHAKTLGEAGVQSVTPQPLRTSQLGAAFASGGRVEFHGSQKVDLIHGGVALAILDEVAFYENDHIRRIRAAADAGAQQTLAYSSLATEPNAFDEWVAFDERGAERDDVTCRAVTLDDAINAGFPADRAKSLRAVGGDRRQYEQMFCCRRSA
jgi:phage FluMu gp28-like protein